MAKSTSCKRLLLIVFLLLCFISLTAQGRSLRESSGNNNGAEHEKGYKSNMLNKSRAGEKADNNKKKNTKDDDFMTMDYTPANKNPPIHN